MELYGGDARRVPHGPRLARQTTSGARTASTSRPTTRPTSPRPDGSRTLPDLEPPARSGRRAGPGVPRRRASASGSGVDGSASNERSDLLAEVKQALLVARGRGGPVPHDRTRGARGSGRAAEPPCWARRHRIARAGQAGRLRGLADGRARARRRRGRGRRARLLGAASGRPARRRGRRRGARRRARQRRRGRDRAVPSGRRREDSHRERFGLHPRPRHGGRQAGRGSTGRARPRREVVVAGETDATAGSPSSRPDSSRDATRSSSGRLRRSSRASSSRSSSATGITTCPLLVSPYGCASYRGS